MRNYGETYEKAYKNAEIPLWNTPIYFDRWLINNCPIQFIQDRLKYQYDDEYEQIKNGTSAYDTYKRTGLGKNFHYKVIRKPNWKPRYNFPYIDRFNNDKYYKENKKPWWLITIEDTKTDHPISWWANTRSEEHTSELQSPDQLVCRLLLEKKKKTFLKIVLSLSIFTDCCSYQGSYRA